MTRPGFGRRPQPLRIAGPAEPGGAAAPDPAAEALARALRRIEELHDQLFELQEQNQQLRRDLADRVCPRLCTRGYRGAL